MHFDPSVISTVLEAAIVAFSVLGGIMATLSGYFAAIAYFPERIVAGAGDEVNRGIAIGFAFGCLPALAAAILTVMF